MEIVYPTQFISSLRGKHLLLDTNVFRDAVSRSTDFSRFFNNLKQNDITLVTVDFVRLELLKGSVNETKYKEKEKLIAEIVDATIPMTPNMIELMYSLIQIYGIDGTALTITDVLLGAMLMQYGDNIALLMRDTTDFIQRVFKLLFVVNAPFGKGIWTYGVYQYINS
ncbi:hypothetical protein A2875_02835 [Candidatus Gottesmanbacteria bacterium RIFCSPHIGHO2_01_FULL_46_14]|uniref:PIN domain-containing protein n=4 Tax=Microgenomates group TaxID=1794810 RepID=A0A1F5ZPM8_9BACT|nr:MAG: hypothetical protein UU34_C0005G0014 [Candidatus Curtissbacteria bacterium GW2011_GWA1_41_11]KKS12400.1 MAG: hypothetical protein UU67_C0054G0010 [Candidatus Daviesbacteria bacterium GW2011_GWB1_41_5]OGG14440.1 MAG: hypothetical protein A2875_02835 [Candidatus Gottesmanbacteria bacterium RIFCSPHIGHO2_01_FULL_46_14]OGG28543.1 MAG: hypothetical protein A2971_03600 [Candidatus Gottesmanbacteria bacterium RIFCSPLOWO2_01_FULL_46_21]